MGLYIVSLLSRKGTLLVLLLRHLIARGYEGDMSLLQVVLKEHMQEQQGSTSLTVTSYAHAGATLAQVPTVLPDWMAWMQGTSCIVRGDCLVSTGLPGSCEVRVNPAMSVPLCSTSFSNARDDTLVVDHSSYSLSSGIPCDTTPNSSILLTSKSAGSSWKLCWPTEGKRKLAGPPPSGARMGVERAPLESLDQYCYVVNGLCWLWASPCAGSCSRVPVGVSSPHGVLRYATETEWAAAEGTLESNRESFFQKCAASLLDARYGHCDDSDIFTRWHRPDAPSSDELILVYEKPTAWQNLDPKWQSPLTTGRVSAAGDPHLVNVYGQRFDVLQPGVHALVQVPKGERLSKTLLRIEADARLMGGSCADLYFYAVTATGHWAEGDMRSRKGPVKQRWNGVRFFANSPPNGTRSVSRRFGKVPVKVVWGHTGNGVQYLNIFMKRLNTLEYRVGGLLGEDDHTAAATPAQRCKRTVSI